MAKREEQAVERRQPEQQQQQQAAAQPRQRPGAVKRQAEPETPPWWVDLLREEFSAKIEASEGRVMAEIKAAELRQSQALLKQTWMMVGAMLTLSAVQTGLILTIVRLWVL